MRKMTIMRGPQGSGKTTILERAGLARHVVSPDRIREAVSSCVLQPEGDFGHDRDQDPIVWDIALASLKRRLQKGETVAFDATLPRSPDVEAIADLALAAGYDVLVVDMYGCDHQAAMERNLSRQGHRAVPEAYVRYAIDTNAVTTPLRGDLRSISPCDDIDGAVDAVREFVRQRDVFSVRDLSAYDRIVFCGDLQGCLSPLLAPESPVSRWLGDERTFFVFVGDLLDRGIENGRLLRWWLDNLHGRPNVALIAGNHEDHIEAVARGATSGSREFNSRTLPQIAEAGIAAQDLAAIANSLIPVLPCHWRGITILASHAGFSQWPNPLWAVPETQFRKGAGFYQHPVDETWSRWSIEEAPHPIEMPIPTREIWQVHGHRNQAMLPVIAGARSINLEGQVEFGGHMRFAVLDEAGWTPVEVRNTVHKTMQEFRMQDIADGRQSYGHVAPLTPWAGDGVVDAVPIDPEKLASFRTNPLVYEAVSETLPHVSALNFTKQAFYDKLWNDVTIHTRGLFVDTTDGTIVARSYPKFWNHGERIETQDKTLSQTLTYPVTGYVKENGYLGITGYDARSGRLLVASKSRLEGDFAAWFRDILAQALGAAGMERLLRFNRDQVASCVFEVIDPVNDPHIIEESRHRVVLLDAIRRDDTFEKMPYDGLVKLASHLGCEVKRTAFKNIPNWHALSRILHKIENDPSWRPNRTSGPVEGVVVEDAGIGGSQRMFKAKAHFYAFWKRARYGKERVALVRRNSSKSLDLKRYADDPALAAFIEWCTRQNDEILSWDIVRLRNVYLADPNALVEGGLQTPAEEAPDQSGFLRGVDAIAAQVSAGKAKADTIVRLVRRADEDEHRRAAFDAHPASSLLRELAEDEARIRHGEGMRRMQDLLGNALHLGSLG